MTQPILLGISDWCPEIRAVEGDEIGYLIKTTLRDARRHHKNMDLFASRRILLATIAEGESLCFGPHKGIKAYVIRQGGEIAWAYARHHLYNEDLYSALIGQRGKETAWNPKNLPRWIVTTS